MSPEKKTKLSKNRSWKACIGIALDEALLAVRESFHDLSDEQVWSRPIPERHSIGTIIMHMIDNLNEYACQYQTRRPVSLPAGGPFDMWDGGPEELEQRQQSAERPSVAQMLDWLAAIRKEAEAGLESASDEELLGTRCAPPHWGERGNTAGDAYTRTIFHAMAHVRQVWCIRGKIGAFAEEAWPFQFYA